MCECVLYFEVHPQATGITRDHDSQRVKVLCSTNQYISLIFDQSEDFGKSLGLDNSAPDFHRKSHVSGPEVKNGFTNSVFKMFSS